MDSERKIYVSHIKNGRVNRTYVTGLEYFMGHEERIKFLIDGKKTLGAAGSNEIKTPEGKDAISFTGNQIRKVKQLLLTCRTIKCDDIVEQET